MKPLLLVCPLLVMTSLAGPACADQLVNGGFEELDASGSPAGWRVLTRLDRHGYTPPDFKQNFDAILPVRCPGGARGSSHSIGFPVSGTWEGKVSEHRKADGQAGVDGTRLGKAALTQTVVLDPGTYVFGAYLRTAGGAAYTGCFSLGYSLEGDRPYADDNSTGITWTRSDLGLKTSFDGTGDLTKRGEWLPYQTAPFTLTSRRRVSVWIRFNYVNNGPMPAKWQVDDAFITPYKQQAHTPQSYTGAKRGAPLRFPARGQMVADCGDLEGEYLYQDHGSTVRGSIPRRMFQHARCATGSASFTYSFPVNPRQRSVYLALEHMGPCRVTLSGSVVRAVTDTAEDALFPQQYLLTDPALWRSGHLLVKFDSPVPGKTAAVAWVEAGATTRFRERIRHVVWDTTSIAWQVGLWDSTSREFRGTDTNFNIHRISTSNLSSRKIRVTWNQKSRPECRYYMVLRHIKPDTLSDDAFGSINIGDDDSVDWITKTRGEEIMEVDVTDKLKDGENAVTFAADSIDFAAMVVVTPGVTDNTNLKLFVGGNDDARNLTRVYNDTLFWLLSLHYDDSGFIDASVPHGKWWQQYWPIDTSFALRALLHWGYLDQAERIAILAAQQAWEGHASNRSGGSDNNGGNLLTTEMCELLRRRGFETSLIDQLWPRVFSYCDKVVADVATSPFGLIKGTNWENSGNLQQGPSYALNTNLLAVTMLLKAAETAEEGKLPSHAAQWRECAGRIRTEVLNRLVFREDTKSPTGWIYPKGTLAYGLMDDGSFMLKPLAGYFWGWAFSPALTGFHTSDTNIRDLFAKTIEASMRAFNSGMGNLVSGYAVSYDGAECIFQCAALADRTDIMARLIPEMLKATDFREDVGQPRAEISRWAYGPPGWEEDTNLVGASAFLDAARYVTGVDDLFFNTQQVRIIPRLPDGWRECGVNGWPARFSTGNVREMTELSYHYQLLSPKKALLKVCTKDPIKGLSIRLGPFADGAGALKTTLDGRLVSTRIETSGGHKWLWVTLDSGPRWSVVRVTP